MYKLINFIFSTIILISFNKAYGASTDSTEASGNSCLELAIVEPVHSLIKASTTVTTRNEIVGYNPVIRPRPTGLSVPTTEGLVPLMADVVEKEPIYEPREYVGGPIYYLKALGTSLPKVLEMGLATTVLANIGGGPSDYGMAGSIAMSGSFFSVAGTLLDGWYFTCSKEDIQLSKTRKVAQIGIDLLSAVTFYTGARLLSSINEEAVDQSSVNTATGLVVVPLIIGTVNVLRLGYTWYQGCKHQPA